METLILLALLALAISGLALPVLISLAPRFGLLDHPGGRKRHEMPTPVVGGLAIALSLLPVLAWSILSHQGLELFFAGVFFLLAISLADDLFGMDHRVRFVMHLAVGLPLVWHGDALVGFGSILGGPPVLLGVLAVPVTLFAVASAINAMNMVDGVDGLLATLSLLPLLFIAWLAAGAGMRPEVAVALSLVAALIVFLAFNFRFPWMVRARVFMGDHGSTVLGFALAWLLIRLAGHGVIPPVLALYLLALPLMDTAGVILRRILGRRATHVAGRDHLHHILLDAGFSVRSTVLLMAAFALFMATCGVLMVRWGVAHWLLFAAFMVLLLSYLLGSRYPGFLVRSLRAWRDSLRLKPTTWRR